jgi:hypothetical protein
MRTFKQMSDDDFEHETNWLGRQTPFGLVMKVLAGVLVLSVVFGVVGFAAGWFRTGTDIISPQNVTEQWRFAYDYDESLGAIAKQWCTAKKVEDAETDPEVKAQRVNQTTAQSNNYDRVAAEYNGRLRDAFRAKWVKPSDVPTQAPTLEDKVAQLGCYDK